MRKSFEGFNGRASKASKARTKGEASKVEGEDEDQRLEGASSSLRSFEPSKTPSRLISRRGASDLQREGNSFSLIFKTRNVQENLVSLFFGVSLYVIEKIVSIQQV